MGCGASTEADVVNKEIDKEIKKEKRIMHTTIKALMLGTGASGKTTVSKQMRLLYLEGFSERDRLAFKQPIIVSILRNMVIATSKAFEWGFRFDSEENAALAQNVKGMVVGPDAELTAELGGQLVRLWSDGAIVKVRDEGGKASLDDSHSYFMTRCMDVARGDYVPSVEDVLRCRVRTLGIHETNFHCRGLDFCVVDVGGQRTERRKWIHCFDGVTIVVYVASLSEYDAQCEEDNETNRMHEALRLWQESINNQALSKINLVLFLNKVDLFKEKIKKVPLQQCFPDYSGGSDETAALNYIQKEYDKRNKTPSSVRSVYRHVTCATDTSQIQVVWNSVADVLLNENMKDAGFRADL